MRRGKRGLVDRQRRRVLLPFLLPAVAIYGLFLFYPALSTFYVALTTWDGISAPIFVGMQNFMNLAQDPLLRLAALHTVEFVVIGGIILFPLAFFFAYSTERLRFAKLYRFFILAPVALSVTTAALLWKFALNPNFGFVDAFFRSVGLGGLGHVQWLGQTSTAMLMVIAATIWSGAGVWMLFVASAIQGVGPDVREAAAIDGASRFQILLRIILPLVWPVTRTLILLWMVQAAQAFGFVVAMTGGGPLGSTDVVGTYLYNTAFNDYRYGYASAIAVALVIVVVILASIAQRLSRRGEGPS